MILLTGATGYIGSHTWAELISSGADVIGVDNFSNSNPSVCERLKKVTHKNIIFKQGNVCDGKFLEDLFQEYLIEAVIHFAALKVPSDSLKSPLSYYENNINGLIQLLSVCKKFKCDQFIFSSSANVYGNTNQVPVVENHHMSPTNPYGNTKWMGEIILRDFVHSHPNFRVATLRYFNPIGAHASGFIGEQVESTPDNLMPYITKVAVGQLDQLSIFGGDWPTHDGTGVRDYIHVVDLAKGHISALQYLQKQQKSITANLGTGKGTSVLDLVHAFESATSIKIPYKIINRRPGDIAISYADPTLANQALGWKAKYDIKQMCVDSWRWQVNSSQF